MKLWIARDKDGELYLYNKCPKRYINFFGSHFGHTPMLLDERLFSEITWENSPQEVELKLVDNDTGR